MEISADEMKKSIEKIYQRLDNVTPVDFDCGKLCGEVCCVYDAEDYRNEKNTPHGKRETRIRGIRGWQLI